MVGIRGNEVTIHRSAELGHWNYFLALESDLEKLSRYVDFSGNEDTYSLEIARLLLGASAEVDVVLKQICKLYFSNSTASVVNKYHPEVTRSCPNFTQFKVTIPRYGLEYQPWVNWTSASPPGWWSAHNKVKHQRDTYYSEATLKHCLNAVGALFISVLHLYEQQALDGALLQFPRLFNVEDKFFGGAQMGRHGNSFSYRVR